MAAQLASSAKKSHKSKRSLIDSKINSYKPLSINFRLLELVEDCGPLPLANDKCKLDTERTNKTASFPYCCPHFTCEDGVKLEYPEIKTDASEKKN